MPLIACVMTVKDYRSEYHYYNNSCNRPSGDHKPGFASYIKVNLH